MRDQLSRLQRIAVVGGLLVVASLAVPTGAAWAAAGNLVLTNPSTDGRTGNEYVRPRFAVDAPCPSKSTSFYAKLYGGDPGSRFPSDGQLIKTVGDIGMSLTEPFTFDAEYTFLDTAHDAGLTRLSGSYTAEVTCQDDFSYVLKRFRTHLDFSSPSTWKADAAPTGSESTGSGSSGIGASASATPEPSPSASEPAAEDSRPAAEPRSEPIITATDLTGVPMEKVPVVGTGQKMRVQAGGFTPGEAVQAQLGDGGPKVTALADNSGVARYVVTVPEGTGTHRIVVRGEGRKATLRYRVTAAPSRDDGRSVPTVLLVGISLLGAAGLAALGALSRRRRQVLSDATGHERIVSRS